MQKLQLLLLTIACLLICSNSKRVNYEILKTHQRAQALPVLKTNFDGLDDESVNKMYTINDCVQIAFEPGDYILKKNNIQGFSMDLERDNVKELETLSKYRELNTEANMDLIEEDTPDTIDTNKVCGLYLIGEPDTIIEINMKYYDINCETGALMAFVDGWELNGEYFPTVEDHTQTLEQRIHEFCNNLKQWPHSNHRKIFHSSQNAALLQYRLPIYGSFIASIRFHRISQPCNILVHDTVAAYNLNNFGYKRNCTLTALFPSTITLTSIKIGPKYENGISYQCDTKEDRLEIGGSSGLDSALMKISSSICGQAEITTGTEQAIFCDVTSLRLISSGRSYNHVAVIIQKADFDSLDLTTLVCDR